jgi:predicted O-methyltransferase YrrM
MCSAKYRLIILAAMASLLAGPARAGGAADVTGEQRQALLAGFSERDRNVPASDGRFLKMLVAGVGSRRVLEVGSGLGYSAIWIGWGLEAGGGHLTTIEIDPLRAAGARKNVEEAGLGETVEVIEGDALEVLPKLEGEFDFVFINAWRPDYHKYFRLIEPHVKPGGIVAAHNAIRFAEDMPDYLDLMTKHPDYDTVFVATGASPDSIQHDGFCLSYKKKSSSQEADAAGEGSDAGDGQ